MLKYIMRRLLLLIPTLILVTVISFVALRAIPGDTVTIFLNEGGRLTPAQQAQYRKELGLDKSLVEQYGIWIKQLVRGDLGKSLLSGRRVGTILQNRLGVTIELTIFATILVVLVAIPAGVVAAFGAGSAGDYVLRIVGALFLSVPAFWIGTLVVLLPAIWWNYASPSGSTSLFTQPGKNLQQFLPAAAVLALATAGTLFRLTRTTMLEVIRADFVRTARAKGLGSVPIASRHVLRNGLLPIVTLLGAQAGYLLGGTVIIEAVFNLTGVGNLMYTSILNRDYPVVESVALVLALMVLLVNLLVDLSYAWLDPRVKYA